MTMIIPALKKLYNRHLNQVRDEIEQYVHEENIWKKEGAIANSGGTLCLHLAGNLKWFIGSTYGGNGYQRERELEFSQTGVSREELLDLIDETLNDVNKGLNALTEDDLHKEFPLPFGPNRFDTTMALMHLCAHLSYHLGQLNYHRRLLDN